MISLNDLGQFLNVVVGGVVVALIVAGVGAYRRIKSGTIVDDDAVIARLDRDNIQAHEKLEKALKDVDIERRARWRAEDLAAQWKRQLRDEGFTPLPAPQEGSTQHDSR